MAGHVRRGISKELKCIALYHELNLTTRLTIFVASLQKRTGTYFFVLLFQFVSLCVCVCLNPFLTSLSLSLPFYRHVGAYRGGVPSPTGARGSWEVAGAGGGGGQERHQLPRRRRGWKIRVHPLQHCEYEVLFTGRRFFLPRFLAFQVFLCGLLYTYINWIG